LAALAALAMSGVFAQSMPTASQLVNRYNALASRVEAMERQSRYGDISENDYYAFEREQNTLTTDMQFFIASGGQFTDAQYQQILNAQRRLLNASQGMMSNAQRGPQVRPTQWQMVVEFKGNPHDYLSSKEIVTVTATSLEEAKEKAIRSLKMTYSWAHIVDCYKR